jgi:hypothetical protein
MSKKNAEHAGGYAK